VVVRTRDCLSLSSRSLAMRMAKVGSKKAVGSTLRSEHGNQQLDNSIWWIDWCELLMGKRAG